MQVQDNAAWLVMENMSKPYFLLNSCDIFNLFTPGVGQTGHGHTEDTALVPQTLSQAARAWQGRHTVPRDTGPLPGDTQGVAKY